MDTTETINHPQHYGGKSDTYEAIKVIESWGLSFHLGNVIKYISRAGKKTKNELQDLKKAQWYLNRYIELNENKNDCIENNMEARRRNNT